MPTICVISHSQSLTILATKSPRWSPYLATTGRRTSVTGFVGFAFNPTDLLMGTRSSLKIEKRVDLFIVWRQPQDICLIVFPTSMTYSPLRENRLYWYWRAIPTENKSKKTELHLGANIWVIKCSGIIMNFQLSTRIFPDRLCERETIKTKCTWTKCVSQDEVLGSWG